MHAAASYYLCIHRKALTKPGGIVRPVRGAIPYSSIGTSSSAPMRCAKRSVADVGGGVGRASRLGVVMMKVAPKTTPRVSDSVEGIVASSVRMLCACQAGSVLRRGRLLRCVRC